MYPRVTALICAYALVANIVAIPAPPRRSDNRAIIIAVDLTVLKSTSVTTETETMPQERTIVIRRVPNAYLYPFSLWPLPKYPITEDRASEYTYNGKTLKKIKKVENNKR